MLIDQPLVKAVLSMAVAAVVVYAFIFVLTYWVIIALVLGILLGLSLVAFYAHWRGLTRPHTWGGPAFCPQRSCKKHLAARARFCETCGKIAYRPPEELAGTKQKIPADVLLSMAVAADMALIAIFTVVASTEYHIREDPSDWVWSVVWEPFGWGRMLAPAVVTAALVVGAAVFVQRSQRTKVVGWHPQCARVHRLTARFCDWTGKPSANEWMDGKCPPTKQVLKQALFQKADPRPQIPELPDEFMGPMYLPKRPPEFASDLPIKVRLHLIGRLEALLDSGHLSVEEFADQKTQLLSN